MGLFQDEQKDRKQRGDKSEEIAYQFLSEQGLRIISRNYLCKMGEIDIIARDNNDLVFVEVRYRKSNYFGGSVESVNRKKQLRIIRAANHYLQTHKLTNKIPCRFDVFAITGGERELEYNWIKAAFQ